MRVGSEWVLGPSYDTIPATICWGVRLLWRGLLCLVLGHDAEVNTEIDNIPLLSCSRCDQHWVRRGHEDD